MGKAGAAIQGYVDATFGRFIDLRTDEGPLTPWTPMPDDGQRLVADHLGAHYGVAVKKLTVLDCGVCRVERADRSKWIARVFPPARSPGAVSGDAAVLAFLAAQDFPAERLATDDPVSVVEDHPVLVTQLVTGKMPSQTRESCTWIGDALGRLHTLPLDGAPSRVGGGWHSLSLDGGGRRADVAKLLDLLDDLERVVAKAQRSDVDVLRRALQSLDLCDGLPQSLVHVDFGGPNLLKGKDGSYTVIDWTGAGRGARIEALASVLWGLGPTGIDIAVAAYRAHVEPEPEELDRLDGTLLTHQLVLACWGSIVMPDRLPAVAAQLPKAAPVIAERAARIRKAFAA